MTVKHSRFGKTRSVDVLIGIEEKLDKIIEHLSEIRTQLDSTKLALSVGETAESLGLSPNTIYCLVRAGTIPSLRIGTRILVAVEELKQFLAMGMEQLDPEDDIGSFGRRSAS